MPNDGNGDNSDMGNSLKEQLLNPKLRANTPLDKLFEEIAKFIKNDDDNNNNNNNQDTIKNLYIKLDGKNCNDLNFNGNNVNHDFYMRFTVIDKLLDYLLQIQKLSNEKKIKGKG
ncbi:hypothetical protein PACTADRAFT_3674 [Pachysolen tannophilus NRRL Y-2460]|uniref:Uncharacterized protein n=1 Tax=Pachysolen tannophilus NRRL Y-2460 TaxID=669874 RepID=A0A1E4TST2_PACTA|nr:hypothetical protein PACTADRAFT_3674 [Pachysolen tannophilus NRRL Y-2460]